MHEFVFTCHCRKHYQMTDCPIKNVPPLHHTLLTHPRSHTSQSWVTSYQLCQSVLTPSHHWIASPGRALLLCPRAAISAYTTSTDLTQYPGSIQDTSRTTVLHKCTVSLTASASSSRMNKIMSCLFNLITPTDYFFFLTVFSINYLTVREQYSRH